MTVLNRQVSLKDYKIKAVNVDMLFNTKARNKNEQTTTFHVRAKSTVKTTTGDDFDTATCNGIPLTCNAGSDTPVTATERIGINELFADCAFRGLAPEILVNQTDSDARQIGLKEATYCYAHMGGNNITAGVAALTAANYYEEIAYGIKELVKKGYSKQDMIVAISEEVGTDLAAMDLGVADIGVRTSDAKSVAAKKFGVMEVVEVTDEVLSGKVPTGETDRVKFRIYVRDFALMNDYCKIGYRFETISTDEHSQASRAYSDEMIGFVQYDASNSAVVCYFATTPAI